MTNLDSITEPINKILNTFTDNSYITSYFILFFITYGSFLGAGGKPPELMISIFKNPIIRILMLTLLAYLANKNIQVSLGIALVFYLTQQYIFKQETFDQIKNLEKFQNSYYINNVKKQIPEQIPEPTNE
jgi:hypothetical protein